MATRCQICLSPHLQQISDLVNSNTLTLKEIAAQFNISVHSLSRHCARHRNLAPEAGSAGADLQSKSDLLWERSNEIWDLAAADADLRSAISSIQTGLRSLELQAKQQERDLESKEEAGSGLIDSQGRLSIQALSEVSEWYENTLTDAQKREVMRAASLDSEFGMLVEDGLHNLELRDQLLQCRRAYLLAKKGKHEPVPEKIAAAN